MKKNVLVFDVESQSLYGKAFAVGAIVMNGKNMIDRFALMSEEEAEGANDWVKENVIPHLNDIPKCKTGLELRNRFYEFYLKHKDTCSVWGDVIYPVETNFLSDVAKDDLENREFNMPYPLYDIANFVDAEIDREKMSKLIGIKKHNPVDDSLASYHCLINSVNRNQPLFNKKN